MVLVIAGFVRLANIFFYQGYLPAPFVFDIGDTFMDWFNTAYWAHNPGAYSVWRTIYLPLSFVITGLLGDPTCYKNAPYDARDCDHLGIAVILLTYAANDSDLERLGRDVPEMVSSGKVNIEINQRYPLADVVSAHRDLENRRTTGTTILTP